jgi:transposase
LARKLARAGGEVRCCYEAGVCGFALKRQLEAAAPLVCEVIAPSLIPAKPGDKVKTDRRDAKKLLHLFEAGLLTEVCPPNEQEEAVRDLCRCRDDLRQDLLRARHRLSKFLLRRAFVYKDGRNWTQKHHEWLRGVRLADGNEQVVLNDYLLAVEQLRERMKSIVAEIERVAQEPQYCEVVGALRCFRGIDTITAMTVVAELHRFGRFPSPRDLMSYLGLTPREHSSGDKQQRGGITKAGNSHVRRVLVEAAHHYRHRPGVGVNLRKRRQGQPSEIIKIADKAQHRLNRRYRLLTARGKHKNKVTIAIARELAGFVWAALQQHTATRSFSVSAEAVAR